MNDGRPTEDGENAKPFSGHLPKVETDRQATPQINTTREWRYLTGQQPPTENGKKRYIFHNPNLRPLRNDQVLIADVFLSWCGPCVAVEAHLKRLKMSSLEKPEALYFVKVCCDNIEDFQCFKDDARPTFLFWARGGPVALLRGINRPLITKLVIQEVNIEMNGLVRDFKEQIDLTLDTPIQCQGHLAELAKDEFIKSVGSGNTDKLTELFQDGLIKFPTNKSNSGEPAEEHSSEEDNEPPEYETNEAKIEEDIDPQLSDESTLKAEANLEDENSLKDEEKEHLDIESTEEESLMTKKEKTKAKSKVKKRSPFVKKGNHKSFNYCPEKDLSTEECEEEETVPCNNLEIGDNMNKIRKKKKKMETGLLREILDIRGGNKRY